jgi:hypothetical protein
MARTKKGPKRLPLRGIPSLTTCEVTILEAHTETTTVEEPEQIPEIGTHSVISTPEEVPRKEPTNFLDLPLELRTQIYEMCVSVTEYITYDRKDFCTCGGKDVKRPCIDLGHGDDCAYVQGGAGLTCRMPGCFYLISPSFGEDRYMPEHINRRMTPRPSILQANSQIRGEALPIFYSMNDFVFENCEPAWVTQWLYNGVQQKHLEYIKSISWNGPLEVGRERDLLKYDGRPIWRDEQDTTHHSDEISAVILLMQLGFLGKCKLNFAIINRERLHVGCLLHQKIIKLVQRKKLTPAHAEDEESKLDRHEIRGLVYSLARHFDTWWYRIVRDIMLRPDARPDVQGNPTSYFGCSLSRDDERVPWITKTPLLTADESSQESQDPVVD